MPEMSVHELIWWCLPEHILELVLYIVTFVKLKEVCGHLCLHRCIRPVIQVKIFQRPCMTHVKIYDFLISIAKLAKHIKVLQSIVNINTFHFVEYLINFVTFTFWRLLYHNVYFEATHGWACNAIYNSFCGFQHQHMVLL